VALFIQLTKKDEPFSLGIEVNNVFQFLKAYFTIAPFCIHVDLSKPVVLETDTFDFAIDVMLSQLEKNNLFHLVNFYFRKFSPTKINYEIHDKKLLTIVNAFEEWRHFLKGVQHEIIMYSNYKKL
jgi:hypothetical protein